MEKIQMKTPLVEMDGDEMTRVLWKMIKDELICPFVELKTEFMTLACCTATRRRIRSPSTRRWPRGNTVWPSNARRSRRMPSGWPSTRS